MKILFSRIFPTHSEQANPLPRKSEVVNFADPFKPTRNQHNSVFSGTPII